MKPSQVDVRLVDVSSITIELVKYLREKEGYLNGFAITKAPVGCGSAMTCSELRIGLDSISNTGTALDHTRNRRSS